MADYAVFQLCAMAKNRTIMTKPKPGRVGRPPADNRAVLEGILWILRTVARWKVERTFSWISSYRRWVGRYERRIDI